MENLDLSTIQKVILIIIPLLFGITVHEVAHGWVASLRGDQTAKLMGRLTLNPIKHIDPVGTILVPAILGLFWAMYGSGFIFGWAKPVPVDWRNLKKPRSDMALVAFAGPFTNLLMGFGWAILARIGVSFLSPETTLGASIVYMGIMGLLINLVLMVLNLIPIPPLDGSRIVSACLAPRLAYYYNQLEPFGIIILIALIATKALGYILGPAVGFFYVVILHLLGFG